MTTVSTAAFYERANMQLGGLRKTAEKLQSQIGSGERLTRSSDDPVAAARLRDLSRKSRLSAVDQANSDRATIDLRLADEALGSVAGIVIRARELALRATSQSLSDKDRASIGGEVETLRASLVTLANSRDRAGHALFGGQMAGAAYAESAGTVTYQGTATAQRAELGDGQTVATGLPGPEVFAFTSGGTPTDLFAAFGALATGLQAGGAAALTAATDALGALDAGLDKVTTAQTVVGTRLAFVEDVSERRTAAGELVAEEQSRVGGADLAATITRLQETMTVLEASQASFVKLASLSLFDMLR